MTSIGLAKMTGDTIGIDISKAQLDVFRLEDQSTRQFENSPRGFQALKRWLGRKPIARIVFEATGPYHGAFERAFSGKQPLVKINPLQARRFAQACGTMTKTDAVDAQMRALMGDALQMKPDAPISENQSILRELQTGRSTLSTQRTRLRNRGHILSNTVLKRLNKARLALVERQIAELNVEISRHITSDVSLGCKREILCLLPGIGSIAAAMILSFLPEIGCLDRKPAGSLAGLVPHSRESGKWKGKSFISGGQKPLLNALYMPALVAMRFIPDLKAKYDSLRKAGKPAMVAIIALMRKLIETANAFIKANRNWARKGA